MFEQKLRNPIILIGAARSGTTMLGEMLAKHPDVAYWVEPKYIWKYRNPDVNNDIRKKEDATLKIQEFIHEKFLSYQKQNHKSRFMEKTPSNCFRIPFIEHIFPDAIYINILRDGRDVFLSSYKMWTEIHKTVGDVYKRRLSYGDVPLRDLPFYGAEFFNQFLQHKFGYSKTRKWGPITPDILKYMKKSTEEACAFQWCQSTELATSDLENIPHNRVLTLKYEEFLKSPQEKIFQILQHCKLAHSEEVIEFVLNKIRPNNHSKWKDNENIEILKKVDYILNPMLLKLGYL